MSAEAKLKELGIELPSAPAPVANYVRAVTVGNLVYVSGTGPMRQGGQPAFVGKVGRDLTTEQGKEAARSVGLGILSTLRDHLGSLDRVRRIVKVLGMVNCTEDFYEQPQVINGFSDLMVEVFGEAGRHARSAVGMQSLPGSAQGSIPVEIEVIVEIA